MNEENEKLAKDNTPEEKAEELSKTKASNSEQEFENTAQPESPEEDLSSQEVKPDEQPSPNASEEPEAEPEPPPNTSQKTELEVAVNNQDKVDKEDSKVRLDNIQANNEAVNAQQNIKGDKGKEDTDARKWAIFSLEPATIKKIKFVFVPSPEYKKVVATEISNIEDRISIVYGPRNSGRFTTAVHLGLDLWGQGHNERPKFQLYHRTPHDTDLLIDFIQDKDIPEGTFFIIENAFESGIEIGHLSPHYLDRMNHILQKKNLI